MKNLPSDPVLFPVVATPAKRHWQGESLWGGHAAPGARSSRLVVSDREVTFELNREIYMDWALCRVLDNMTASFTACLVILTLHPLGLVQVVAPIFTVGETETQVD